MNNNFFFLILAVLFLGQSCQNTANDVVISGNLEPSNYSKIYLSEITSNGIILIDSVDIKKNRFSFRLKANNNIELQKLSEPAFYQLAFSDINFITTVAKAGDKLVFAGDPQNFVKNYTVEGSKDAVLMLQLDRLLSRYIDTVDRLYSVYEQNIDNELVKEQLENEYNLLLEHHTDSLLQFIEQNSQSFTSIIAFYQTYNRRRFIDEKEHLSVLTMLTNALKTKYPLNENVIYLEDRINRMSNLNN